jgi:hypothetical protein|tara:strand:- start:98 stop:277 length:180 start_codon:yes stop_codon:yes gene_type:complete
MKIIELTKDGVWFEDSYTHECFATFHELKNLFPKVKDKCPEYGSTLLNDKCEVSLAVNA